MKVNNYYLGLDIGTNSVGYAVTDRDYGLLKKGGEPMWGVTLFDAAALNTDRRAFRTARRRLDRRQQRVQLVEELFAPEVGKTDERFFIRLQQSALLRQEAGDAYPLFCDADYTDREYHAQYPTIHHLIYDLMTSSQPHDVRLVCLACIWLVAHRGHFFSDVSRENIDKLTDFSAVYRQLTEYIEQQDGYSALPWQPVADEQIADVLKAKLSITAKYKKLCALLFAGGKAPKQADGFPYPVDVFLNALCGHKTEAKALFGNGEYEEVKSFTLAADDDALVEVLQALGDDAQLIRRMKAVYDWSLLVQALGGYSSISEAKIHTYQQHSSDLKLLKTFVRKYLPAKYDEVFRSTDRADNYVAYSAHAPEKAASGPKEKAHKQNFCDYIRKLLSAVTPEEVDVPAWQDMMERLSLYTFLPKQKEGANRVIPHQLYWYEMDTLLRKAEAYLPFLARRDESGLSVREKLMSVFLFRVPYFVGPLNPYCQDHAWMKRKAGMEGVRITPWNFSSIVDEDASEHKFIRRMLNKCTYLPAKTVLPKESLLYHRFTVLNEINTLRINEQRVPVEAKQGIYEQLFLKHRKVTFKQIEKYLLSNGYMQPEDKLGGIDTQIKSDLKPYHDFARLLASGALTEEQAEQIIEHITYTEDGQRLKRYLQQEFPALSEKDRDYLSRLKYKDFGRLSAAFLTQLEGADTATGEITTIMKEMWHTNQNLMELLSEKYTFLQQVEAQRKKYYDTHQLTLQKQMKEMYLSNAVKRPVLRALQIVKEVVKATGHAPEKIFVEVTRGEDESKKNQRTASRAQQLRALYEKCDTQDVRLLSQQLEAMGENADNALRSDSLYLYYLQLGKCMYTGKAIDISQMSATCNIDHIYPQSVVKDDSVLNNKALVFSEANEAKADTFPISATIQKEMRYWWDMLLKNGLMTEEKHRRLIRTSDFTGEERLGFINRQLTETSQSVKAVATLLKQLYPDTRVVYSRARLVSDFRQKFDMLKSRTFNDLHHAKDAYLNIVTGNVYDMRFNPHWFDVNKKYTVKIESLFTNPVIEAGETVWRGAEMIGKVKKIVFSNHAHMTRYAYCRHGGFFKQQPVKADTGLIPRKANLPTEKYGGYKQPSVSFFVPVKYREGKKSDICIMSVQVLHSGQFLQDEQYALAYAKQHMSNILNKQVDEVSFVMGKHILKTKSILMMDGFRMCLDSSDSRGKKLCVSPFMPLAADEEWQIYLKRIESLVEKSRKNANYVYSEQRDRVSSEQNLRLYHLYVQKFKSSIYSKRTNKPIETLEKGENRFINLTVIEQAKVLLIINSMFGTNGGPFDLSLIGGKPTEASSKISSFVSNWKKLYSDVRIVDCSASGLWESVSDNLLDLL